jgi:hypothetical protein
MKAPNFANNSTGNPQKKTSFFFVIATKAVGFHRMK